jgi:type II secretory pathway pseudopilin PulG
MRREQGDTIVEVLLATIVIAVVLTGAYALTNRATRINQSAIERTEVSNLLKQQIEIIRGSRSSAADSRVWLDVKAKAVTTPPNYSVTCPVAAPPANAFYFNQPTGSFSFDSSGLVQSGIGNFGNFYNVWVEAVSYGSYIDFHVRACWEGIGDIPEQNSALVMRLAV